MATVPEMACDVMDFYRDNDDSQFYEADGPNQKKQGHLQYPDLCSKKCLLEEDGIQLKFTAQSQRFYRSVVVVVAIEKMRHLVELSSGLFQDNDLMNIFTSIFQEEPITIKNCDIYEADFRFASSGDYTIQDLDQKCLALTNASELKALHLSGPNISQQVIFSMKCYLGEVGSQKTHVVLCIKKNNLYLSCVKRDGKPILQLEQVDSFPKEDIDKRFVFNKTEINNKVEFESEEYPNWYISTSQLDAQEVFLGNMRGGQEITNFFLDDLSEMDS
ncbi:interleukin-1 beta isoform X1 [Monodelphis domestica]|uniref:interleukin-1 beta isoform X1 n=1 Tax=Monodelphis domestica TaxID=13616 RepID=UPI000443570F|nr:interleukin-1 beta isoform X1 [Monodelphis domestica]